MSSSERERSSPPPSEATHGDGDRVPDKTGMGGRGREVCFDSILRDCRLGIGREEEGPGKRARSTSGLLGQASLRKEDMLEKWGQERGRGRGRKGERVCGRGRGLCSWTWL